MIISQDNVRPEVLWVKDGEGNPALPLMIELLKYGHKNSKAVILEGILDAEVYDELFITAKKLYNDNIFAYYYDIPFEETTVGHQTRDLSQKYSVLRI